MTEGRGRAAVPDDCRPLGGKPLEDCGIRRMTLDPAVADDQRVDRRQIRLDERGHGPLVGSRDVPARKAELYEARQRQWLLQPSLVYDLGARGHIALGPVLQYSTIDSTAGRFISESQPYGFGDFGQAGLQAGFHYDSRFPARSPGHGILADVSGSFYPALWDVESAFGDVAASASAYLTIPVPLHPILLVRGGARKVFGEYPFNEAAFIFTKKR